MVLSPLNPKDNVADALLIHAGVEYYKSLFGLPSDAQPRAESWVAVSAADRPVLVVGERWVGEGHLEVTDCYPLPWSGFAGKRAMVAVMRQYRTMFDEGKFKTITTAALFKNLPFQHAVERTFGVEPIAVVYTKCASA